MWPNPQETANLVITTEKILNGKLHVLCSAYGGAFCNNIRAVGSFFMVEGGLNNNVGHCGWPTTKNSETKHWLKRHKAVPPKKYIWFKMPCLKFLFWKYYFGHTIFYIRPHGQVDIIKVFFKKKSEFLAKTLKASKK